MPSPIILGFNATQSLCSLNTVVVVVGGSIGTITAPLTPLNFSSENFAAVYGREARLATHTDRFSNETLYNEWSNLPVSFQERFWNRTSRLMIEKRIYGAAVGIQAAGAFSAAAEAVEELLESLIRRFLTRIVTSVGLDALQSSQSTVSTLYGVNGTRTYDQNISEYSNTNTNVFIIQGSVGALVQAGLNLVIFGNFPSVRTLGSQWLTPNSFAQSVATFNYIRSVFSSAKSVAFVGDAAIGFILPGAQIQILAT